MSKYVINDTTLIGIGDAIRAKGGTSDLIPVSGLADAITNLPNAEEPTILTLEVDHNGEYYAPEGVHGYNPVIVDVEVTGAFGPLTVTENGVYRPGDYDLDGFKKVTVEVPTGGGDIEVEPIYLSGALPYACSGPIASQYIKLFGDTITTSNLMGCTNMFEKYQNSYVPFELNFRSDTNYQTNCMFNGASIIEVPVINYMNSSNMSQFFNQCYYLKKIPEGFSDTWNFNALHPQAYGGVGSFFSQCYALRSVPESMLRELYCMGTYNTYTYYRFFKQCRCLDKIEGMPVALGTLTSNNFSETFEQCARINKLTFAMNDDGSCKTANWKSQIIDLTQAGYVTYGFDTLETYGGITPDKEVYDDTTYQDLKNDPDWYSANANYSRYNHASAVETINTLPDCSASGGTNNIKFNGAAGALTDGGAISDLTEEEIAVATAKGWTVSFA